MFSCFHWSSSTLKSPLQKFHILQLTNAPLCVDMSLHLIFFFNFYTAGKTKEVVAKQAGKFLPPYSIIHAALLQ